MSLTEEGNTQMEDEECSDESENLWVASEGLFSEVRQGDETGEDH
jgi:hypothetical protein